MMEPSSKLVTSLTKPSEGVKSLAILAIDDGSIGGGSSCQSQAKGEVFSHPSSPSPGSKSQKYLLSEVERVALLNAQPWYLRGLIDFLATVEPVYHLERIGLGASCSLCPGQAKLEKHHKVAIKLGYRLGLLKLQLHHPRNIQILCQACHARETLKEITLLPRDSGRILSSSGGHGCAVGTANNNLLAGRDRTSILDILHASERNKASTLDILCSSGRGKFSAPADIHPASRMDAEGGDDGQ